LLKGRSNNACGTPVPRLGVILEKVQYNVSKLATGLAQTKAGLHSSKPSSAGTHCVSNSNHISAAYRFPELVTCTALVKVIPT
jgi:hypothetical protein